MEYIRSGAFGSAHRELVLHRNARPDRTEVSMAKPNYHHARQQRERARKARQQEKLQRRTERDSVPPTGSAQQSDAPATTAEPGEAGGPLRPRDGK